MFLHNVALQERAIAADGIEAFDLAVNPLSVVLLCLRPLNNTGTLAEFQSYRGICAALNRVSVLYRGEAIKSLRGEDLAALNYYRWGIMPFQGQHDDTDNERRCVVLPIMMGRWPYSPRSCFPATRRGELVLECDFDIADTGYDGLRFSVETIELLDAKPSEYEKFVQVTQTMAATGDQDMDLVATGNLLRGILLFGTTPFAGASPAPSWGRLKVLLDNQEAGYANTDFETAQMLHCLWGRQPPAYDGHMHRITTSGCAQTALATISGPLNVGAGIAGAVDLTGWHQYCFLDYDPTGDDAHSLRTFGKSRLIVRSNVETADAVRAVPIEVIKL
jgi:hypothetical protein